MSDSLGERSATWSAAGGAFALLGVAAATPLWPLAKNSGWELTLSILSTVAIGLGLYWMLAALIPLWPFPGPPLIVTPRMLFQLGVDTATVVWVSALDTTGKWPDQQTEVTKTLKQLRLPSSEIRQFLSLVERRSVIEVASVRSLFVVYFDNTYTTRAAAYFALGFDLTSALPMLDMMPGGSSEEIANIASFLREIVDKVNGLSLPAERLNAIIDKIVHERPRSRDALTRISEEIGRIGGQYKELISTRTEEFRLPRRTQRGLEIRHPKRYLVGGVVIIIAVTIWELKLHVFSPPGGSLLQSSVGSEFNIDNTFAITVLDIPKCSDNSCSVDIRFRNISGYTADIGPGVFIAPEYSGGIRLCDPYPPLDCISDPISFATYYYIISLNGNRSHYGLHDTTLSAPQFLPNQTVQAPFTFRVPPRTPIGELELTGVFKKAVVKFSSS